jgi:pimeloyl-ACP methyl ester carboxylesterase
LRGRDIDVPGTIVFGQQDRVVPQHARLRDELPEQARWLELRELRRVLMWDGPASMADAMLETSSRSVRPGLQREISEYSMCRSAIVEPA